MKGFVVLNELSTSGSRQGRDRKKKLKSGLLTVHKEVKGREKGWSATSTRTQQFACKSLFPSFQSCKAEANQESHSDEIKRRTFGDCFSIITNPKTDTVQPWTCGHLRGRPIA